MKKIALISFALFMLFSCNGQTSKKESNALSDKENKPKIDYKVDKKYDENGNLVAYDSVYTYYYSNIDKDAMIKDSIFQKFNTYFETNHMLDNSFFNDFFKQEGYRKDDFFSDAFFEDHFKKDELMMNEMLQRMDSIKNQFFINEYPIDDYSEIKKDK